jgi:predicted transcriptional regulator
VAENPGCSNEELIHAAGTGKWQVSRVGRRLSDVGLVRKRRTGTRNRWQITPRGTGALHAVDSGAPRSAGRQRATA